MTSSFLGGFPFSLFQSPLANNNNSNNSNKMKFLFLAVICGVAAAEVFFEERFDDGGKIEIFYLYSSKRGFH